MNELGVTHSVRFFFVLLHKQACGVSDLHNSSIHIYNFKYIDIIVSGIPDAITRGENSSR